MITPETILPKSYAPRDTEPEIHARWDAAKAFHADPHDDGPPYCILIPPPNVTAALHLGHAFNNSLQDILIRHHRMRGFNTLWMPGTDHAGIATQTVVDKRLQQEGKPALKEYKKLEAQGENGREKFISQVQQWKDEYESTITDQLKLMGCSCDWDRQRFTMDEMCAKAVREAFFRLFKDKLIYRGKRLVNWDPATQTALADDEVENKEVNGHFWYMKYPLEDGSGFVTVATTRPETMLGDTAVAVNPKDPQRAKYIGKKVRLPIVNRIIPIVGDDYVVLPNPGSGDPKAEYASGFLKVTPAHDLNDWDIGIRHDLEAINIMAPDASISDQHGWPEDDRANADAILNDIIGLSREKARSAIVEWFKKNNLLENVRDYTHSVGFSYRSHVAIEPYLSDQWYVKVSDDRLVGEAQRALADDQYDGTKPARQKPPTSRAREEAETTCFFITYTTYGTWLHGDERGSVDRKHNLPGSPILLGDENREKKEFESLKFPAMKLDEPMRQAVQDAILEVCAHRQWELIALHIRATHLHCVVMADTMPERVMTDFKSYATRRLREQSLIAEDTRVWTRHGSTRYLNDDVSMQRAAEYVIEEQGSAMRPQPFDGRVDKGTRTPLPHGRGSLENDKYDNAMRFFPARYAKMYQSWHDNLRDWCISRQLWWGHRIPVWSGDPIQSGGRARSTDPIADAQDFITQSDIYEQEGRIARQEWPDTDQPPGEPIVNRPTFICVRDGEADEEVISWLSNNQFKRDPDVLDTWFSSGLWPLSTMGWPTPDEHPDTAGLLDTFNPTSVLCTAREIITLWVSRMTMFNRYFNNGKIPFEQIYIHAMIQDGHGQKMSKSLGNGVDPRDIIHSHGADAMRFTLTQMATPTQDVRMPVDTVCPHCEHTFHPNEFRSAAGYMVAEPTQKCPKCSKKMTTVFGFASGEAKVSDAAPLARNTSSKFDIGKKFCNKVWNATRFALSHLSEAEAHGLQTVGMDELSIADRWIISKLHTTVHTIEDALKDYQFNVYADAMYDFIWRDLCDWYLELIKPTVAHNDIQQQVLRTVLNAAMRLLHPICPFVTETLWPAVCAAGDAGITGVSLPAHELLARAPWPVIECKIHDTQAVETFERVQELTGAIRNLRSERLVPFKKRITLHTTENMQQLLDAAPGVVETLAGLEHVLPIADDRPADAIPLAFEGAELLLSGLVDAVDVDAERKRLGKIIAEKTKLIDSLNGRLSNEKYIAKAPAKLVDESRKQLEQAAADLDAARKSLDSLDDA